LRGGARLILIYQNRSALVVQTKLFDEKVLVEGEKATAGSTSGATKNSFITKVVFGLSE
jgi:hypothetical protein